jgi:hypothetical protein
MPSFFEQVRSHAATVFHNPKHFADDSIVQWPNGVADDAVTFAESPPIFRPWNSERHPQRSTQEGEVVAHRASLQVLESVEVSQTDIWVINGDRWQVEEMTAAAAGVRVLHISRYQIETRKSAMGYR